MVFTSLPDAMPNSSTALAMTQMAPSRTALLLCINEFSNSQKFCASFANAQGRALAIASEVAANDASVARRLWEKFKKCLRGRPMKKKRKKKRGGGGGWRNSIKLRDRDVCPKYQGPWSAHTSSTRGIALRQWEERLARLKQQNAKNEQGICRTPKQL